MNRSTNRLNRQPVYTTDLIDRDEDFFSAHLPKNYSIPCEKPSPVDRFPSYSTPQEVLMAWVYGAGLVLFLFCLANDLPGKFLR